MCFISEQPEELLNVGHTHKRNVVLKVVTLELEKTNEQGE